MQELHSMDEIPAFQSEGKAASFRDTHGIGPEILDQMGPLPDDLLPAPRGRKRLDGEAEDAEP
jgi:hypothetical protein